MNTLMKEMISPNVTKMIPLLHLRSGILPSRNNYKVVCHGRGVFEFVPNHTRGDEIFGAIQKTFIEYSQNAAVYPVSVTGLKTNVDKVGSHRFCTMDYDFAKYLTEIIKDQCAVDIIQDEFGYHQMLNVSQYFRFMRYKEGGEHFPHYDSDFVYHYNEMVTKYSLVVYFSDCNTGDFAFVNDPRENDCSDWDRQATEEEIWLKVKPSCMKILLFPHTLCHTVLPFTDANSARYIARGDILFMRNK